MFENIFLLKTFQKSCTNSLCTMDYLKMGRKRKKDKFSPAHKNKTESTNDQRGNDINFTSKNSHKIYQKLLLKTSYFTIGCFI